MTSLFHACHHIFHVFKIGELFLSFCCSLVVADVTFYVANLKSLSGLDSLDDTMDDIWDKS